MAKQSKCYLLAWDMTGLESVIDLGEIENLREEYEKERTLKILSSPGLKDPGNQYERDLSQWVNMLMLRARANSQRHYEIYTIHVEPTVNDKDLWEMFMKDPQYSADLIRDRGNCLYSDRVNKRTQVIV